MIPIIEKVETGTASTQVYHINRLALLLLASGWQCQMMVVPPEDFLENLFKSLNGGSNGN